MTTQKQSLVAQVTVAVIVGFISSIVTGAGTAYVMTNKFDKKLDAHIIENRSVEAQMRRDIARIEMANMQRDKEVAGIEKTLSSMASDIAFIRGKFDK